MPPSRHAVGAGVVRADARVFSTLHMAYGNPHAKKPDMPVIEVRVQGNTVGFLTPAMTKRYKPFIDAAEAQGRTVTATTVIDRNPQRSKGPAIEVSLLAVPRLVEQRSIAGLDVEMLEPNVLYRRTNTLHVLRSETPEGLATACGRTLAASDVVVIHRTKPYVGWVAPDGSVVDEAGDSCGNCANAPKNADPNATPRPKPTRPKRVAPDPGRYGKETDVTGKKRGRQYSTRMNYQSVMDALTHGLDFDVAGESFRPGYPNNLLRLADVLDGMEGPEWVGAVLRRDPGNDYDTNAIEVHVPTGDIGHVGFVPAQLAAVLAPILDSGVSMTCSAVEVRIGSGGSARPGLTACVKSAG
jgi:hypothetical protein